MSRLFPLAGMPNYIRALVSRRRLTVNRRQVLTPISPTII